jgi:hypothetical protein
MKKVLISSGCSFTFEKWNWPGHLSGILDLNIINVGMASQGNGLISRKLIYAVENALKNYSPDEILVGVMWSGTDRTEYHTYDGSNVIHWGFKEIDPNVKNPTNIVDGLYNWRIINHHWKNKESLNYYENFHTAIYGMVLTIEHMLRVQWYLKNLNIDYFMTTYMDIFNDGYLREHREVEHLFKMVDFNMFLPVSGCYEWVKENYKEIGLPPNDKTATHPTSFGHRKFTEEVIIPYLEERNII